MIEKLSFTSAIVAQLTPARLSRCPIFVIVGILAAIHGALPLSGQECDDAVADYWHQWRGPDMTGVSRTAKPPIEWSEREKIQWKVEIEGEGKSTPIIRGEQAQVTASSIGACQSPAEASPGRSREHPVPESPLWLTFNGQDGRPGNGKHVLLLAADQEYRSEQVMPMLAKILATHHGFDCTVLFSVNDEMKVDPTQKIQWQDKSVIHNVPGLEHLQSADLFIVFSRLITLPDEQVQHIINYLESGKPVIGIRTANHGFLGNFPYQIDGKRIRFGEDVLGGTFRSHHGNWHADSTRGIIVEAMADHPILRGVEDIWGPSDVYRTYPEGGSLPADCQALVYGQPLMGRQPDDEVNDEKEPLPIAWTKTWTGSTGETARVFHVTMGSGKDYESAGLRRLTINAAYWCLGMEDQIQADSNVGYVGEYRPLASGFNYEKLQVIPKNPAEYR